MPRRVKRSPKKSEEGVEVEFRNITITVAATDAKDAYAKLCEALGKIECDWRTDVYVVHFGRGQVSDVRETEDLWPIDED